MDSGSARAAQIAQHVVGAAAAEPVKWGIMGTANIANIVLPAIVASPSSVVLACASRSAEKAKEWAAERDIPRSYGGYQALLDDDEIDAVYIPLPTTLHIEWVVKAAEAKKHVLVEKPVALTMAEMETITSACEANGVLLMDAVHWMHNPRTPVFMDAVRNSAGPIRRVNASFCFPAHRREGFFEENIRTQTDADPLGGLGDLGWYTIRGILVAMDWEMPTSVTAQGNTLENGVPLAVVATMQFASGCLATMDCGFDVENREALEISGREGTVRVDGFVLVSTPPHRTPSPSTAEANSFTVTTGQDRVIDGTPEGKRTTSFVSNETVTTEMPLSQEAEMMECFSRLVADGSPSQAAREQWAGYITGTQRVANAVLESLRSGGAPVTL